MTSGKSEEGSQDGAQGEIGVGDVVPHHNDAVPIRPRVLVQNPSEEVELLLDGAPGLLPLCAGQLHGGWTSASTTKMRLAALGQRLVRQRDEDWEERLGEDLLDVVNEKRLYGARALGKDGPSRVGDFKILGDDVGIG